MSIENSTLTKNAATDAAVDGLDVGAAANGTVEIRDAADAVLATFDLPNPAFGDASGGEATANAITAVDASADGTAAKYVAKDADGAERWRGTAGRKRAVSAASTANKTFGVDADLTGLLSPGDTIRVSGSTGNDGVYTVYSVSYSDPTTTIEVVEAVPDATADGDVHPADMTLDNTSIASGQQVNITSWTHQALRS